MLSRGQAWAGPGSVCVPGPSRRPALCSALLASCPYACRVPHFPMPSLELAHDWRRASWAAHRAGISAAGPRLSGAGQGPPAVGVRPRGPPNLPSPLCTASPFPICHPSHATLFLSGGGGGIWMFLSPSFYLLSFSQPKPSSSALSWGHEAPTPPCL